MKLIKIDKKIGPAATLHIMCDSCNGMKEATYSLKFNLQYGDCVNLCDEHLDKLKQVVSEEVEVL